MTLTLLHGSDVHFGKPHRAGAAKAFLDAAHALAPDVIVISGDFTQRAKVEEYEAARHFLDRLPDVPLVVTPGNHDVPLYRFWERALVPFRNYRRFLGPDLDTVTRVDGATIVALNSAAPRTAIVNGVVTERQLGFGQEAFAAAPRGDARIAVIHHNLVQAPDDHPDPVVRKSDRLLAALADMGVDLLLGGHLHRGFVVTHPVESASDAMLIVMSGTTTSGRGRQAEKGRQSYNVVRLDDASIQVERFLTTADGEGFSSAAHVQASRRRASAASGQERTVNATNSAGEAS